MNHICKVCDSTNTVSDIKIDGRQRYKCLDCKILFFDDDRPFILARSEPIKMETKIGVSLIPKYKCKKCDSFQTDDRWALTSHYSSVHSWHKNGETMDTSTKMAKLPEKLPTTPTCAKTQAETKEVNVVLKTPPASELIIEKITVLEKKIEMLDSGIGDLLNRGYMDEDMKAVIIASVIDYYTGPQYNKDIRAKKVLAVAQAIEGV